MEQEVRTSVIQKKTGLLLGWCDVRFKCGRYVSVPYVCEYSPITTMLFRWRFPHPDWSSPQIIAHGIRDAKLLSGFEENHRYA